MATTTQHENLVQSEQLSQSLRKTLIDILQSEPPEEVVQEILEKTAQIFDRYVKKIQKKIEADKKKAIVIFVDENLKPEGLLNALIDQRRTRKNFEFEGVRYNISGYSEKIILLINNKNRERAKLKNREYYVSQRAYLEALKKKEENVGDEKEKEKKEKKKKKKKNKQPENEVILEAEDLVSLSESDDE